MRLRVLRDGKWVATPFSGPLAAGPQTLHLERREADRQALDGAYAAVIEATDAVGTSTISLPFLLDAHAPAIKLYARPPRIWVSEAATVTVRVNGSLRRLEAPRPRVPGAQRHQAWSGRSSPSPATRPATRPSSAGRSARRRLAERAPGSRPAGQ